MESNSSICKTSESQNEFSNNYLWFVNGVIVVCIAILGIFLNSTSLYIIQNKKVKETIFNTFLMCATMIDILLLLNIIYTSATIHLLTPYLTSCASNIYLRIYTTIIYPSHRMLILCSFYTHVLLAYERYNCIANPVEVLIRNKLNKNKNRYAKVISQTLPVILLSIVFNIPTIYDLKIGKIDSTTIEKIDETEFASNCTSEMWGVARTEFGLNRNYRTWYLNISNLVVFTIIPVFLMGYFNFRVYKLNEERLRKRNIQNLYEKHEQSLCHQKVMLSIIVVVFVVCNIPDVLLNLEDIMFYQLQEKQRQAHCDSIDFWVFIVTFIRALVLTMKCSLNFFMYHIYDVEFINVFKSFVVSLCQWRKVRHINNGNIETFELQEL